MFYETYHSRWKGVFNNLQWLSFYTAIVLFLGLAIVRVLYLSKESTWIINHLRTVTIIIVIASWSMGAGVCIIHNTVSFTPLISTIKNMIIMGIVFPTTILNLYVCVKVMGSRSILGNRFYRVTMTSFGLFTNFFLCYVFFIVCYIVDLYWFIKGKKCPQTTTLENVLCTNEGEDREIRINCSFKISLETKYSKLCNWKVPIVE